MRVARIAWKGEIRWAEPIDDELVLLAGSPIDGLSRTDERIAVSAAQILTPVPASKLIGIGANFPGEETLGPDPYPAFFIKPPSAFAAHGEEVRLPHVFASVLAEGELALVMKRRARRLTRDEAPSAILGWTVVNDLSGRDSTLAVVPPAVKKSADGFAPMGPYLDLDPTIRDFTIKTFRNGEQVQQGSTADLRFGVVDCLVHVSSIMTLEPYDLIALGTPPPKPKLVPGDEVAVQIEGIGTLINRIAGAGDA